MAEGKIWSEPAKDDLLEIMEYIEEKSDFHTADKVIDKILAKVDILETFPEIGTIEWQRTNRVVKFRFLLEKPYRIIYHVDTNAEKVFIDYVIDTRQDPNKIKE